MKKKFSIFCDGGARGNPGPAAVAFVVSEDGKIIHQFAKKIGRATNNVAEYQAVIAALEWLNQQYSPAKRDLVSPDNIAIQPFGPSSGRGQSAINFFLDSQLLVNQLNGLFKIKDHKLRLLILEARGLELKIKGKIFFHLISREKNKIADGLVNQALNDL